MTSKTPQNQNVVNVHMASTAVAAPGAVAAAGKPKSKAAAYALWILGAGILGLHRFYLRRPGTWLLVPAVFVMGYMGAQEPRISGIILLVWTARVLLDLVMIPRWVREHNATVAVPATPAGVAAAAMPMATAAPAATAPTAAIAPKKAKKKRRWGKQEPESPELRTALLRAAHAGDGKLTVTQGVMISGKTFEEVEACLEGMRKRGYIDLDYEADSGVVVYVFPGLIGRPDVEIDQARGELT